LNDYDIISSLEDMISGHFTLIKSSLDIYKLILNDEPVETILQNPKHLRFDEVGFSEIVLKAQKEKRLRVFWDNKELKKGIKSEVHQEYLFDRWKYKEGKVVDLHSDTQKEYMYLHFINWKRTMKYCKIHYSDDPEQFYISYNGMHYKTHSHFAKALNRFKNLFDGFYIREGRRIRKLKRKSLKKRVVNKINKILGWK